MRWRSWRSCLMRELVVELGLAEQYHLHQLAFFGFQIGQQAQRLQRFQRHRLRFVQAHHHALARSRAKSSSAWLSVFTIWC